MTESDHPLLRIRKNLISLSFAEIVTKITGTVMYLFLARYLGPERFGQYTMALTYAMLFGFIADLGFDSVLIRDISRHPERARDYFRHSLFVKLCSGAIAYLVAAVFVTLMGYPKDTLGVILLGLTLLFITPAIGAMDSLFKGLQQMVFSSVLQISRNLLTFVLIMVLIFNNSNLRSIVSVPPLVAIIVFLISYVFVVKRKMIMDMRLNLDTALLKSIFRESIPFFMLGAIYTVNSKIHILMLSKLGEIRDVGLFNAVNEIINVFWVLPILVSTVMFPVMSRQFIDSREELAKTSRHVNRVLAAIGIPLGWGIIVLAPNILGILYGSKYAESVPSFRLLAISLSVGIPLGVNGWLLAAMDKVNIVMWINLGCLLFGVGLNTLLMPRYGSFGAAISTATCSLLFNFTAAFIVHRMLPGLTILRDYLRPVLCALVMLGVLLIVPPWNVAILILAGMLTYITMFYFLRGFQTEEWQTVLKMVRIRP